LLLLALTLQGHAEEVAPEQEASGGENVVSPEAPPEPADLGTIEVTAEAVSLAVRALPGQSFMVLERSDWGPGRCSLAGLLERASPVSVAHTGGEGSLATLSLRAAGAASTLVMLNGVPLALPGGTAIDLSLFDPSVLERVEIIPGAASLHGTRAIGGVVNLVTRGTSENEPGANLSLSAGSFGTAKAGWFRTAASGGRQDTLVASLLTTRGDFSFETVNGLMRTRRNNDAQRFNLLWQRQQHSASRLATSFLSLAALRRGVPGFAEFPAEHARLTEQALTLGWDEFTPGATGGWQREDALSLSQSLLRFRDDEPARGGPVRSRATQYGVRASRVLARQLPGGAIEIAAAADLEFMSAQAYGNPRRASSRVNILRNWEWRGFALTPSLALDWCEGEALEPSWDVAGDWTLWPGVELAASAGRSFRFPEFAELYYPPQGFIRGNPDLKPERADYVSIGVRLERGDGRLTLDAYQREHENAIRFVPVSAYAIRPLNTGRSRTRGLEAWASFHFHDRLSATAAWALTDAEFVRSGIEFTQTPRHRFHCALTYEAGEWHAELRHFRESAQNADLFGSIRVPAQETWGFSLAHRGERGELALSVQNLFDRSVRDFWDLPMPGRIIEVSWNTRV